MTSPTSETSLAPVSAEVVWFSGDDALRFLDDLISQEIADMKPGDTRRSLLLGPQGKLEFVLWVVRDEGRIGLMTEPGRAEELATALGRYRIRVDVEIAPEADDVSVVVGDWDGYDVSWAGVRRTLVIGKRPELPIMPAMDYDALRIRAGEPLWGVDVGEGTIPHESSLVPVSVDFAKGCYLGQELVARIDSRGGNAPRRLLLVDGEGADLAPGPLTRDGDEAGVVTSASGQLGLAMVKRAVEVGETVQASGSPVVVRDLPAKTPG